ncbi:MAG: hypothetical protein H6Q81_1697, partial [Deltaproteobacteria bacterium]|nr:hypothetical protein [Deltaproteobacteria bacterium]
MAREGVVRPVVPQHHPGPIRHVLVAEGTCARRFEHGCAPLSPDGVLHLYRVSVSVLLGGARRFRFPQRDKGGDGHRRMKQRGQVPL